jgi:hypothetical protein
VHESKLATIRSLFTAPVALLTVLCSAALLSGCITRLPRTCRDDSDPGELARLANITDSTAAALRRPADSQFVGLREYLQGVVNRIAVLDQCGRITTAADLRTSAKIGVKARTLGAPTLVRAYDWSRRAVMLDTADRRSWRVMAAAWDHLQVESKQPQWFGTVVECPGNPPGRCLIPPVDTTRVSDPQRVELGLRTLVQQRAAVDSMNRARGRP